MKVAISLFHIYRKATHRETPRATHVTSELLTLTYAWLLTIDLFLNEAFLGRTR